MSQGIPSLSVEGLTEQYISMRSSMDDCAQILQDQSYDHRTENGQETDKFLADLLLQRYSTFGGLQALEASIFIYRRLLPTPPSCSADIYHHNTRHNSVLDVQDALGEALSARYEQYGEPGDISEAVTLHEESIRVREDLGLGSAQSLHGLGLAKYLRGVRSWCVADLREAAALLRRASQVPTFPGRTRSLCYLSLVLSEAFLREYDAAISVIFEAFHLASLNLCDYMFCSIVLGQAVTARRWFLYPDDDGRIARLIDDTQKLASAIGHPYSAIASIALTQLAFVQPNLHLSHQPLEISIDRLRATNASLSPRHIYHREVTRALSRALQLSYEFTGKLAMLDEGITVMCTFVDRSSDQLPFRPILHNLSIALHRRYKISGRMCDLEEAIEHSKICVAPIASTPHVGELFYMEGLGYLLVERFRVTGDGGDLETAVELHKRCIGPVISLTWQEALRMIGLAVETFSVCYATEGDISGIETVVPLLRRVLASADESEHFHGLRALAICLRLLGDCHRNSEYAREAISVQEKALSSVPDYDPLLSEHLANLALCHICLWQFTKHSDDMANAVRCFSKAVGNRSASPQSRLRHALAWCKAAVDTDSLLEAYRQAVSLLPRVVLFGGNLRERIDTLKSSPGLSVRAAMHALACARPLLALQLLEQGRAVFWAQALASRERGFHGLPADLAQRLAHLSRTLEVELSTGGESLARRQRLVEEFDGLVDEARRVPACEHFLGLLPESQILKAASRGPVVVLLADATSAWAVIVHDCVVQVPLPGVNTNLLEFIAAALHRGNTLFSGRDASDESRKLIKARRQVSIDYDVVLEKLWMSIVHPIIVALRFRCLPGSPSRPRLFWCPTGAFAFLPLHASGLYKESAGECVSDFIISSYTPTLSALLNAHRDAPQVPLCDATRNVLLAAVPRAPGYGPLVHASEEVQRLKTLLPGSTVVDGSVTVAQLEAELLFGKFLHLACHGKQDSHEPLKSGLVFHDGLFTLASLMEIKVPGACFAFLSACESAMGDEAIPDETIHLAAAMLFIGFRSVIATMWSMHDVDGPVVAERVYKELIKDTRVFDYDAAPRALDAAVRHLREQGVHASRWATWIHMGI